MSATQTIKPRNGEITFRGVFPKTYNELTEMIHNYDNSISDIKRRINVLAVGRPVDMFPGDNVLDNIQDYVDDLMCQVKSDFSMLLSLNMVKSFIDEYVSLEHMSKQEAYDKVVVDMYADLRNEITKK